MRLRGAHAFADNPPLPLKQFVAAFNIDSAAIAPRGTPLAIVGRGLTKLDPIIEEVAKRQGRKVVQNDDANVYVKRQDGWALLQHDVPAVMVTSAYGDLPALEHFFNTDYHRPSDDLKHPIELGGALQREFGQARSRNARLRAAARTKRAFLVAERQPRALRFAQALLARGIEVGQQRLVARIERAIGCPGIPLRESGDRHE